MKQNIRTGIVRVELNHKNASPPRPLNDRVIDAMLSAGISVRNKALDTDFVSDAFLDICVASLLLCFV